MLPEMLPADPMSQVMELSRQIVGVYEQQVGRRTRQAAGTPSHPVSG